jgi:hypothetical protein
MADQQRSCLPALSAALNIRRARVCLGTGESLRKASIRLKMRHLEGLLCELNDIDESEVRKDLRFHGKEYLILPPQEVVNTQRRYALMRGGETLMQVLKRRHIRAQWEQVVEDNPWAEMYMEQPLLEPYAFVMLPDGPAVSLQLDIRG